MLSLPATVVADLPFQVSAATTGIVVSAGGDEIAIKAADGSLHSATITNARNVKWLVSAGAKVAKGYPVASASHVGFALRATVSPENFLRITGKPLSSSGQISGSSAPFACTLVDPLPSTTTIESAAAGDSFYGCSVPAEVPTILGMAGQLALVLAHHNQVLAVPIEAVAGSVDNALVNVKQGKSAVEKRVELGGSNGYLVEITSGLREGDVVLTPSPSLLRQ